MPQTPPIVCVSFNSPPQNDAEAICTARLLSSLAEMGCEVHWITAAHTRTLDESVEQEIVSPKIRITRVQIPCLTQSVKFMLEMRHQVHVPHLEWVSPAITAARKKLSEIRGAVLLTRSMPVVSNIVGYYCRSLPAAWIAHLSDPYPFSFTSNKGVTTFASVLLHRRWAKRIIENADLITVTCQNAARFMKERLRIRFTDRTLVLTHLGLPKLARGGAILERKKNEFWLAHFGALMTHRNPEVLLAGLSRAAKRIPHLRFLQLGYIDSDVVHRPGCDSIIRLQDDRNLNPRDASDLREQVDVNVIVDADIGTEYSPFIASKYPHSVCSGRPLLMITHPDSAMNDYTRVHGGGVVASYRNPGEVERAILELHSDREKGDRSYFPSSELLNQFSAETIIPPFIEKLKSLAGKSDRPHPAPADFLLPNSVF
jgi:glycosyltransferase involved in cell wall biosynthesis